MSVLDRVKHWLFDTWKISVPDEWLSACWEWIQEERVGRSESFDEQCNHVFDQWLISDLREIDASCFPPNLGQCDKHFLSGIFAAQINCIVDISQPMYKQLQRLTGTENENASVDAATQTTQRQQEDAIEKISRMMMMILTDGCQEVKGIEREVIPSLNHKTPLGTKVIVHGGVICHKGVLLLKPENLTILGGEVEAMMQFTQKSIVEEKLRIQAGQINPTPGSNFEPHELPRADFPNFTLLSCSDLSLATKKSQTGFGISKGQCQQAQSYGNFEPKANTPAFSSGTFRSESSGNSRIKTETSRLKSSRHDPTGSDDFSDDGTDLLFEEAMIATGIDDSRPVSVQRPNASVPNFREVRTATAGFAEDAAFSGDDEDLVFEEVVGGRSHLALPNGRSSRPIGGGGESTEDLLAEEMEVDMFEEMQGSCLDHVRDRKRLKMSSPLTSTATTTMATTNSIAMATATSIAAATACSTTSSDGRVQCRRPFSYISHILKEYKQGTHFVKAYVSTVVGRLERNGGEVWSLQVRVDDGSATLVAQLHDGLLTKLIGYSASECEAMRQRIKSEPHLKDVIKAAIKRCQDNLINMSGIFELRVVRTSTPSESVDGPSRFVINDYREVAGEDLEALREAVSRHGGPQRTR